jgi:hypothetical protein
VSGWSVLFWNGIVFHCPENCTPPGVAPDVDDDDDVVPVPDAPDEPEALDEPDALAGGADVSVDFCSMSTPAGGLLALPERPEPLELPDVP